MNEVSLLRYHYCVEKQYVESRKYRIVITTAREVCVGSK